MSYRPITDCWILVRPRSGYYGGYPLGFVHRARELLGVGPADYLLHACSGKVREYPYHGLGRNDFTLDLDADLAPDFCQDIRDPWPLPRMPDGRRRAYWDAVLSDPPYSEADCAHYACGSSVYPAPAGIVKRAWEVLRPGGRCGILHTQFVRPPKDARLVAVVHVLMGFGNVSRCFTVVEKPW